MQLCSYKFAAQYQKHKGEMWKIPTPLQGKKTIQASEEVMQCPYCQSITKSDWTSTPMDDDYESTECRLIVCPTCGWWQKCTRNNYICESWLLGTWFTDYLTGEAYYYDISSLEVSICELRNFLKRHPKYLSHVHPTVFEKLIQDCFKSVFGPCEVIHIGGSGDGGIDLKLTRGDMGTYLVQVKRRENLNGKEGVQVVRELNGVLFREGEAKGMVVTTARDFTEAAKKEIIIKTPTKESYEIKLLKLDDVVSMLQLPSVEPYVPWENPQIISDK